MDASVMFNVRHLSKVGYTCKISVDTRGKEHEWKESKKNQIYLSTRRRGGKYENNWKNNDFLKVRKTQRSQWILIIRALNRSFRWYLTGSSSEWDDCQIFKQHNTGTVLFEEMIWSSAQVKLELLLVQELTLLLAVTEEGKGKKKKKSIITSRRCTVNTTVFSKSSKKNIKGGGGGVWLTQHLDTPKLTCSSHCLQPTNWFRLSGWWKSPLLHSYKVY